MANMHGMSNNGELMHAMGRGKRAATKLLASQTRASRQALLSAGFKPEGGRTASRLQCGVMLLAKAAELCDTAGDSCHIDVKVLSG